MDRDWNRFRFNLSNSSLDFTKSAFSFVKNDISGRFYISNFSRFQAFLAVFLILQPFGRRHSLLNALPLWRHLERSFDQKFQVMHLEFRYHRPFGPIHRWWHQYQDFGVISWFCCRKGRMILKIQQPVVEKYIFNGLSQINLNYIVEKFIANSMGDFTLEILPWLFLYLLGF